MTDFLLADGFGNLSDGLHLAADREILGDQWISVDDGFTLVDQGDGRKWLKNDGSANRPRLQSKTWAGQTTIKICFRVYRGSAEACALIGVYDGASKLGWIGISAAGILGYYTDNNLLTLVAAATTAIPVTADTFIEMAITFDGAAGVVSFYLNGVLSNTETNLDTINSGASCTNIIVGHAGGDSYCLLDDWKLGDIVVHTGTAPIGDVGVYYREADTAGTDDDFTPSAGNNEDNVDEIGPDEDATYNESDGTSGHRDSFTGDGISGVAVLSVQAVVRARKTGSGAGSLLLGALHGGSEDQSAAKALSTDYLTLTHFVDDCPSTAATWTPAQVTAAEVSYEVD